MDKMRRFVEVFATKDVYYSVLCVTFFFRCELLYFETKSALVGDVVSWLPTDLSVYVIGVPFKKHVYLIFFSLKQVLNTYHPAYLLI